MKGHDESKDTRNDNTRLCACCNFSRPKSEFAMDEHWCDACCWDALETEALGELEQQEAGRARE